MIFVIIVVLLITFLIWQNNGITVSSFSYKNNNFPKSFNNFKILQISDFHNKQFGKKQYRILSKIKKCAPDIIIITGDLIDRRKYNLDIAMELVMLLPKIAPVYYVCGNHETLSCKYDKIKKMLRKANVTVLDNEASLYNIEQNTMKIVGLKDPGYLTSEHKNATDTKKLEKYLSTISNNSDITIYLSHRPELINIYTKYKCEIVFCGHTHGGQIRIPFLGGLIAPGQGLFPKYSAGRYDEDSTTMFISRGLGNSLFPQRIFNRPELLTVTINKT